MSRLQENRKEIPIDIQGLSMEEVVDRKSKGAINSSGEDMTRSTKNIIWKNSFTLFNVIIMALALIVIMTGEIKNAIFFWVAIINSSIGIFQEIKAKKTIENLTLLTKTNVSVVRGGELQSIPQDEIVLDDILYLSSGNQVPSDGKVIHAVGLEVDESLLTGESDNIIKRCKDSLMSGSFITAGEGYIRVTAVGEENYSVKLAKEAKVEKKNPSELMNSLNTMIKVLSALIIPIGVGLYISQYRLSGSFKQSILGVTAAVVSMIPQGLMLLTSVAFAVGAANLAKKKTLVQSLPCIETLARVDTICLDKTGTITDGTLRFERFVLQNETTQEEVSTALSEVMQALPDWNATAKAIRERVPSNGSLWTQENIIPFSSARKWSGVTFSDHGSYVMGAPEFIFQTIPHDIEETTLQYTNGGYRVLSLVQYDEPIDMNGLPQTGNTMGLLVLSDRIRENAKETFSYFENQDVTLKVISGDNPISVSNIAIQAGIRNAENYVDMSKISESTSFTRLVEEKTVFGRVTPYQKRELIRALKKNGHTTCMTGDGVNDVLSLREADVGVAMASGSDAAKSSSDVVLLNSNFSTMIDVLNEGRKVINNIERVASMYLVKTIYSVCLSFLSIYFGLTYPFTPLQLAPINTLTVGIPSFFLALKPSYERIKGRFLSNIIEISLPAAFTVIFSILILQVAYLSFDLDFLATSTMNVLVTGCVGFVVLYQVADPLDLKKKIMIGTLFSLFLLCFLSFEEFFTYGPLLNRNAFFYLPLVLGCKSIFIFFMRIILMIETGIGKVIGFIRRK